MKPQKNLKKAVSLLAGLTFESGATLFDAPVDTYQALVSHTARDLAPEQARNNIENIMANLLKVCMQYEDVYRRIRGDDAFWLLILSAWNANHLMQPVHIQQVISLFVGARRRFNADAQPSQNVSTLLTTILDRYIAMVDDVPSNANITQRLSGITLGALIWPEAFYSPIDVAVLGEGTIRTKLFGISPGRSAREDDLIYPHRPADADCSLYLAPVASIDHEARNHWHKPTGYKSRFYATVDEFLTYARDEFHKTGAAAKSHVVGLLNPWFFEKDALTAEAARRNDAIPNVWKKTAFRAGLMLGLSKPGKPTYPYAAEPSTRRNLQDAWIRQMVKLVEARFMIVESWTDGAVDRGQDGEKLKADSQVGADSVEA
ncbi:Uu.00g039910.m01.CDS01 [Anthostomella pinea]|uniref:Uu.00g039910.m01.CDS01 n=1 Tax=Anthostomella pinea TaxID=933095 RepID=A0AAI8YE08_9PEZI|nr:Uu.00g039910.m01.CDS01 [Anthostomella pinea]